MATSGAPRQARVERKTKETQILLQLDLDGTGVSQGRDGIPFFSHMLEAWSKHGLMDLGRRRHGATSRWTSTTRWRTSDSRWGGPSTRRSATRRGSSASAPPSCPWTRRWSRPRSTSRAGPYLVFNVPLQRAKLGQLRSRPARRVLPRLRHRGEDEPARHHALRRQPAPRRRGRLQGGGARAGRGHPHQPPHRGILPSTKGACCDRHRRLRAGQPGQRRSEPSPAWACPRS